MYVLIITKIYLLSCRFVVHFELRLYGVLFLSFLVLFVLDASFDGVVTQVDKSVVPLRSIREAIKLFTGFLHYLTNLRREHPGTVSFEMLQCTYMMFIHAKMKFDILFIVLCLHVHWIFGFKYHWTYALWAGFIVLWTFVIASDSWCYSPTSTRSLGHGTSYSTYYKHR